MTCLVMRRAVAHDSFGPVDSVVAQIEAQQCQVPVIPCSCF